MDYRNRKDGLIFFLQSLFEKTRQKRPGVLEEIEWRGRKIQVRPEGVRLFLLADKQLNNALSKASSLASKIELLENNLMDCKDAIASLRDEMKGDPVRKCILGFLSKLKL